MKYLSHSDQARSRSNIIHANTWSHYFLPTTALSDMASSSVLDRAQPLMENRIVFVGIGYVIDHNTYCIGRGRASLAFRRAIKSVVLSYI